MEPDFRFYLLYDKIYREDILRHVYDLGRSNKGAPRVDGITFEMIEANGLEEWLSDIRKNLIEKTYRPAPVRAGDDPKARGQRRAAIRHPNGSRPRSTRRCQAGIGTDLRGGPRSQRLRLSSEAGWRPHGNPHCATIDQEPSRRRRDFASQATNYRPVRILGYSAFGLSPERWTPGRQSWHALNSGTPAVPE